MLHEPEIKLDIADAENPTASCSSSTIGTVYRICPIITSFSGAIWEIIGVLSDRHDHDHVATKAVDCCACMLSARKTEMYQLSRFAAMHGDTAESCMHPGVMRAPILLEKDSCY